MSEQYAVFHAPTGMYLADLDEGTRVLFVEYLELAQHGTRDRMNSLAMTITSMMPDIGHALLLVKVEPSGCDLKHH